MRPSDHCLRMAIVSGAGAHEQVVSDLASGLVRRGHRVRADGADVVNNHAADARAIELAAGLPVLHTLRVPPTVNTVLRALRETSAPLAAVSEHIAAQLRDPV